MNVETKLPTKGKTVLVEYRSRDLEYKVYTGEEDWWKRNIRRWLDESAADAWISVDDQLPEIGEYVMVYNTERARLIGRLMSNGWIAMFWDGEQLMGELTATHWRELPAGPKG